MSVGTISDLALSYGTITGMHCIPWIMVIWPSRSWNPQLYIKILGPFSDNRTIECDICVILSKRHCTRDFTWVFIIQQSPFWALLHSFMRGTIRHEPVRFDSRVTSHHCASRASFCIVFTIIIFAALGTSVRWESDFLICLTDWFRISHLSDLSGDATFEQCHINSFVTWNK